MTTFSTQDQATIRRIVAVMEGEDDSAGPFLSGYLSSIVEDFNRLLGARRFVSARADERGAAPAA